VERTRERERGFGGAVWVVRGEEIERERIRFIF
jgi:hypothetical protein